MRCFINLFLVFVIYIFIAGCSEDTASDSKKINGDHVWKEQTDKINKAKEVESILLDSAEATNKIIEEQDL